MINNFDYSTNNSFFLGANTRYGFVSLYEDFIKYFLNSSTNGYVYVIKGGPGTGKSTFIKKVCELLGKKNYSYTVLKCSGDINSLDGVYSLEAGILVLDGTSPHCVEVGIPGVEGTIINFSEFWNEKNMLLYKDDITDINQRKREHYSTAYSLLSYAGSIKDHANKIIISQIDNNLLNDKVEIALHDVINYYGVQIGQGNLNKIFTTAITAQGMKGNLSEFLGSDVDNYNVFEFSLPFGFDPDDTFKYIAARLRSAGYNVVASICGFDGKTFEHIYIPEIRCAFVTSHSNILLNKCKDHLKFEIKTNNAEVFNHLIKFNNLLMEAEYELEKASISHKLLEEYYVSEMNFKLLNEYTENVLFKINEKI